jgi:PTS system fructose-specific IIA component/PTS system nitrogen regulatory IIA component
MKLSDYLIEDALIDELQSGVKKDAISELVASLVTAGAMDASELDSVVEAVMERELNSSTALGRGVALPHARHSAVKSVVGVLGRSTKGIEFSAIDNEPVHAVILIISPPGPVEPYLGLLSMISKLFSSRSVCRRLRESDRGALIKLINDAHEYIDD